MGRKHQLKLSLSLCATEGTPEYDALYYIKNGPLPEKEAAMAAIAAVFSMSGAAIRGGSETLVKSRIADSSEAFHGFQMRALQRIECSVPDPIANKKAEKVPALEDDYLDQNEVF